jgi:hypothetical protein
MPINATAQDQEIIISQGAKAPFSGVLVPEDTYRYYQTRELEADSLSKLATESGAASSSTFSLFSAFLGGALLGIIGISAVGRK